MLLKKRINHHNGKHRHDDCGVLHAFTDNLRRLSVSDAFPRAALYNILQGIGERPFIRNLNKQKGSVPVVPFSDGDKQCDCGEHRPLRAAER